MVVFCVCVCVCVEGRRFTHTKFSKNKCSTQTKTWHQCVYMCVWVCDLGTHSSYIQYVAWNEQKKTKVQRSSGTFYAVLHIQMFYIKKICTNWWCHTVDVLLFGWLFSNTQNNSKKNDKSFFFSLFFFIEYFSIIINNILWSI